MIDEGDCGAIGGMKIGRGNLFSIYILDSIALKGTIDDK
jgi:hypothetical protein